VGNFTFIQHDGVFTGQGAKKAPAWSTSCTKEEVDKKIQEFWETRVSGNPDIWKLLHMACSQGLPEEAEAICLAGGLQLVNGTMVCTQDDAGFIYELPPFVINPAIEYGKEQSKTQTVSGPSVKLTLKLRSTGFRDTLFECSNLSSGFEIKEFCAAKHNLNKEKIRCFYAGRELKNDSRLQQFGVKDNEIITVLSQG